MSSDRTESNLPLFAVPGSGRWPAIREAVGSVLHHARLLRGVFRVRLLTDRAAEFAAEGTLPAEGVEVRDVGDLPADPETCGAGTFYGPRTAFFGLKVRLLRDLAAAEPPGRVILLLDSDVAALRDLRELPDVLPPDRDLGMVLDRFPNPVATRTRPRRSRYGSEEEWAGMERDGSYSEAVPTFNTGVILLRAGPVARRLADAWLSDWLAWRNSDQQALSRVLHARPALRRAVLELPARYNRFVAWQAGRAAPGEGEAAMDREAREGTLSLAHNHDVCRFVYRRSDAWERSERIMRRAGLRPGMTPRVSFPG
jgi:hypothetical protein